MFENGCASDSINVIDRRGETDCAGNIWRACFKSMRCFLKCALLQSDAHNHFTPAMPRRYGIENLFPRVQHSDASRATHFVSGEGHEIAAQCPDIDRQMSDALCRIHKCECADRVRFLTQLRHRINRAQRVGYLRKRKEFYLRRK